MDDKMTRGALVALLPTFGYVKMIVSDSTNPLRVECVWFDEKNRLQRETFHHSLLKVLEPGPAESE